MFKKSCSNCETKDRYIEALKKENKKELLPCCHKFSLLRELLLEGNIKGPIIELTIETPLGLASDYYKKPTSSTEKRKILGGRIKSNGREVFSKCRNASYNDILYRCDCLDNLIDLKKELDQKSINDWVKHRQNDE